MELTTIKPANDMAPAAASAVSEARFSERRQREAQSDVKNQVVYFSPVIRIDAETNSAILQYRDSSTGKVKNEFPAKQVGVYKHAQELEDDNSAPVSSSAKSDGDAEEPVDA